MGFRALLIAFMLLLLSHESGAGPPAPPAENPGPGRNSELYLRANDQIGLRADFLREKLKTLEELSKDPPQDDPDPARTKKKNIRKRQQMLGAYCRGNEGADACYDRYRRAAAFSLIKTRPSVIHNSDNAAKLQYHGSTPFKDWVASDGKNVGTPRKAGVPTSKDPKAQPKLHVPYSMNVPKLKELHDIHKRNFQAQRIAATPQYLKSVQEMPREKATSDFIIRKTVKLDPRDPDEKAKTVIETNCKEGPHCKCEATYCYDLQAYKEYEKKYEEQKAQYEKELQLMTDNPLRPEEVPEHLDPRQKDPYARARDPYIKGLTQHIKPSRVPAKNADPHSQTQVTINDQAQGRILDPNVDAPQQAPVLEGQGTQLYIKQNPEKYTEDGLKILNDL